MNKVPAFDKLLEVMASGIGAVAGPMMATWRAKREGQARIIAAEADARVLAIRADAHRKAREGLLAVGSAASGEISLADRVHERITYQERKRLTNIQSVAAKAALQLDDREVPDTEPDHDWTARFFNDVQDVSSEEMQKLWAKVLAGEVERPGSISIRALGCLKELDRDTANLFARFCSACIFEVEGPSPGQDKMKGRVSSLGGQAAANSLEPFGFDFRALSRLSEHGLIIPAYDSRAIYRIENAGGSAVSPLPDLPVLFQGKGWLLGPEDGSSSIDRIQISGPALNLAGGELAGVLECEPMPEYAERLQTFLQGQNLRMRPLLLASK